MEQERVFRLRIAMARYIVLFMTLLSVVNVISIYRGSVIYMPFSSAISTYSVAFGNTIGGTMRVVCYGIALLLLVSLFACYFLSKDKVFALLIVFPIVISDTFVLIILTLISGGIGALSILDILLHIITIIYIFWGIKAYIKLSKMPNEDASEVELLDSICEISLANSLDEYFDDGTKPMLMGTVDDLNAFAVIRNKKAELVVNGYVCDSAEFDGIPEYTLQAVVNNVDFLFEYKRIFGKESMYLYADDILLDSLEIE